MSKPVPCFNKQTPIVEWHVRRCGSKNKHQNYIMRSKEIELRAQTLLTILHSKVHIIMFI